MSTYRRNLMYLYCKVTIDLRPNGKQNIDKGFVIKDVSVLCHLCILIVIYCN